MLTVYIYNYFLILLRFCVAPNSLTTHVNFAIQTILNLAL